MDVAPTGGEDLSDGALTNGKGQPSMTSDEGRQRADIATKRSTPAQQADGNKFQQAISAWRKIDLSTVVPTLDAAASDIVSHQRDSLVQRKDLAQKTKDFRKLDDSGKIGEIKGLLKAYQTFIDTLTNHTKSTSSAFLQVYSTLSEAPDPYPLLEASVESLVLSEETLPKIAAENQHLQESVSKLTTQLDDAETRLESERKALKDLAENQETKAKEVEASWAAVVEEKRDNWGSKERALEEKVENQERLLKELRASYEVSQRLDTAETDGAEGSHGFATAAELEMVHSDLERTSSRLAEVEARNEQLRMEIARSVSQPAEGPRSIEDDPNYLRIRSENASLLRKIDAARISKQAESRGWESTLRSLEREVANLQADRDSLRAKVKTWNDYDDIKRELDMLKSIEFATGDDDDEAGVEEPTTAERDGVSNGGSAENRGESLEKLLLARNKKLSNDLTVLRVSHRDLQDQLEAMQEGGSRTNAELERARQLAATLEDDLLKMQREAANQLGSSAQSVAGTYTSRYPQSSAPYGSNSVLGRRGRTSPTSSIISGFDPQHGSSGSSEGFRAGEPIGGGSGILPMVTAQRDRFKQRNAQLEAELQKSYTTVSSLRQEMASLQKDNLDLYEKTRYVSSYNRGHQGKSSSSTAYATSANPATVQMSSSTSSGMSMDRYKSAYEANISPFAAFRGRESARALRRMSVPERMVFSVTRMVLANRTSRNLFAAYCVALHLLVFGMLYWIGTIDVGTHAAHIGEAAAGLAATAGRSGPASGSAGGGGDTSAGDALN